VLATVRGAMATVAGCSGGRGGVATSDKARCCGWVKGVHQGGAELLVRRIERGC
jgi:hypothetical protein